MRLKNVPGSREKIAESEYVIKDYAKKDRAKIFGTDGPLHIEIGTGKGAFLTKTAAENPQINYIGIEKYSSVLIRAVEKQEEAKLGNLRFLRMEAEYIEDVFEPEEAERIYLNFSDPWPKEKHAKRRLTSRTFLKRYERILKEGGLVEFRTDNKELFDFSVNEAKEAGWEIVFITEDFHSCFPEEEIIMTEYEEKFSVLGRKILKFTIKRP